MLKSEESAQSLVEYALILAFVCVVCVVVVTQLGLSIRDVLYPDEGDLGMMFGP